MSKRGPTAALVYFNDQARSAGKEKQMNVRKAIDYSELFAAVDRAVSAVLPQMELYREIGQSVSLSPKGRRMALPWP